MTEPAPGYRGRYESALALYVARPDERGRSQAYELGRQAAAEGVGLLEFAALHQVAVAGILADRSKDAGAVAEFFFEALSTFDMAQRGFWEAQERARADRGHADRLSRLNDAVVAIAAKVGHDERLRVVAEQARVLLGPAQAAVVIGDAGVVRVAGDEPPPDLRFDAASAQRAQRSVVGDPHGPSRRAHYSIAVPLPDRVLARRAAIVIWRDEPFGDGDLAMVEQLAHYAALALDMAARLEEQHEIAITLQETLLPREPVDIPGLTVAWRYLAAVGNDVGGDWYDVFPIDPSSVALVVGDVMGHDLKAAALMGQLRLALQAYAIDGHRPTEVLDRVDRLLQRLEPERLTTVLYAVVDHDRRRLRLTNAGHPPPILIAPNGHATRLTGGLSLPLGVDAAGVRHRETAYGLKPGSFLLFYSDGLIEDRAASLEDGISRLLAALTGFDGTACELCDVALTIGSADREDDICLLAVAIGTEDPA